MAFNCGGTTGGPWTLRRRKLDGTPNGQDVIRITREPDPTTGEMEGEVVMGGIPVRGRCIDTPVDLVILAYPASAPTHLYFGLTSRDPDGTIRGSGTYRITTDALAVDEGTWGGEKPPV